MHNEELARLLGQDVVAELLLEDLQGAGACLVRLTGASGSGKSQIARRVAKGWRSAGGACVVATGDARHAEREYYPLLSGVFRNHLDWVKLANTGTESALRIADSALPVGNAASSVFDLLKAPFRQRLDRALKPYSSTERDILIAIKRLARSRPILLIADDAHRWDPDSLRLLADLLSERLREAIPAFNAVVVLVVDTSAEQPVSAPEAFDALVEGRVTRTRLLAGCSREEFPRVLATFGVDRRLPEDVIDALFVATSGHLALAEQIAAHQRQAGVNTEVSALDDEYVSSLFSARFASLGSSSPEVTDLLARAAVLGLTCTEDDLLCITESRPGLLRALIEQAESIGFIECAAEGISFRHEVIHATILSEQTSADLRSLYLKLSKCLAILRPGEYAGRARALFEAGEDRAAREMVALASVAQIRRGVPRERVLRRLGTRFPEDTDLIAYLQGIAEGYAAVSAGDFSAALPLLRASLPRESKAMAAERNYLVALCSMGLQTTTGIESALSILSSWAAELSDEVELSLRFLLLLQQAQVLAEMFEEARETEVAIDQKLTDRTDYDADAEATLHVQHRRSAAIDTPDIAERRIARAVAFFREGTQDETRDAHELFRGLTNLAAIQLRLNRNREAYASATEAEHLAVDSLDVTHRLDALASNLTLAGFRSGAVELGPTIERQHLIVNSPEGASDNFIQRCNLAAFLLLAARDGEAREELGLLGEELEARELTETYLVYYWNALWIASAAVRGETEEALRRHHRMDDFVAALKWPCAPYVRRRQVLLAEAIPTLDPSEPRIGMDRVLLDGMPLQIGNAWPYYGRLMPCVELSFWSDS